MLYQEMNAAIQDAEKTLRFADMAASSIAEMLVGRLRKVDTPYLDELKRELKNYNMQTGQWRD